MKIIYLALLACVGCAPATYLYSFDLTDPGAQNFQDFRRPDALEDGDVKVELRADPTEFKAVALDVTNKTDQTLQVAWDQISIIDPMHGQNPLRPNAPLGAVEPTAKMSALLVPFELPAVGPAAAAYDGTNFEVVVPMVVRGTAREYRYHLHVTMKKL
jgi:hypothetical protein